MLYYFIIALFLIIIKADELPLNSYSQLNTFKIIDKNESFIINTNVKSIAYFDSFDKNSIIYISNNYDDFISEKDEKISGKFYHIEPNQKYYIRNYLYASHLYSSPSVFKTYLYPLDLSQNDINITEQNFLYLEKDKTYILNFKENKIKKMITLSRKTLNTKIKIIKNDKEEIELNQNNLYYKIEENFVDNLILEVSENDAFIEFLSDYGDYKILEDLKKEQFEITNNISIIKIPKNQKNFQLILISDKNFSFSFSYGFSNAINYYYLSNSNIKINSEKENDIYKFYFLLNTPFKDIYLKENEFLSFSIILEKELNQKVNISYQQNGGFMEKLLNEEIEESICKDIIDNLKNLLEFYVYLDIAQNPPSINGDYNYHHRKINLKEELSQIPTANRKYYEFYQDIIKILTVPKDLHFSITAYKSPKNLKFKQYFVYLPFNFIVKKYNKTQRIFIEKNKYFQYIPEHHFDLKNFIDSHLDIPLKKINDIDPFDYIQNWSKYHSTKNPHAQFTNIIKQITSFYLVYYPINFSDINLNEYEFEDNKILKMNYLYDGQLNKDDKEFDNYFLSIFKSQKIPSQMPPIDEIKENYLILKGLKKKKIILKEEKLKWDFKYEEKNDNEVNERYIKCRVDEINHVNVFVQNTFYQDINNATAIAFDCARLFYSNNYPLIIIETKNNGGYGFLAIIMQQIFQIRTANRGFKSSHRLSNITKEYFKLVYSDNYELKDVINCNVGTNYNSFYEVIDHYNYNGMNIEHKRTNIFDIIPLAYRDAFNNFREEYKKSENIKNPTDIIIFTDSFSYSAGSVFIQDFQRLGGAIVVGYFGNPKGKDLFDSSQAYSSVVDLENTDISKNLNELGFVINGVTIGEFFDYSEVIENPIPREYTVEPVDERVDIYSPYSDEIYDLFIKEGKRIHDKYNKEGNCNPKNDRLHLHDDKCQKFEEGNYIHGGYKCGNDGYWDKTKCVPYYCDIGYYFDHYQNKCIKDCIYSNNTKFWFIHEKNYDKEFVIGQNMTYEFEVFNFERYYYIFEIFEGNKKNVPKIFPLSNGNNINIKNKYDNENLKVRIKSINSDINPNIDMEAYFLMQLDVFNIAFEKGKKMITFQCLEDSNFYIKNILNITNTSIQLAKYNNSMTYEDIIKINKAYYYDYEGDKLFLKKDELVFIYYNFNEYEQVNFYLTPIRTKTINFSSNSHFILYLEKGKNYILNGTDNNFNILIKLDRKTINSEVFIKEEKIKLNKNNLYHELKGIYKGILNLEIKNEDALIEIFFKPKEDEFDIINLKGNDLLINLKKKYNFIEIPKKYSSKIINFNLDFEENSIFMINPTYSIAPYTLYYKIGNNNKIISKNLNFNITNHYKSDIKLMEKESYYVIIQKLKNDLNVTIKVFDNQSNDGNRKENNTLLIIISVVVGSVILILIIITIIVFIKNKKAYDKLKENVNKISFKDEERLLE